jgi:hypothetical protein
MLLFYAANTTAGFAGQTHLTAIIAAQLASKTIPAGMLLPLTGSFLRHINFSRHTGLGDKRHGASPDLQRVRFGREPTACMSRSPITVHSKPKGKYPA